jgi:hypothetical protein
VLALIILGTFFVLFVTGMTALRSRQRFQVSGDAFRCRLRIQGHPSAIWPWLGRRWSRPMWALWDEDVLVVRRGPGLARIIPSGPLHGRGDQRLSAGTGTSAP